MGKWSAYGKKFCAECEKETGLKEWIRRVSGDEKKAFCRFCRCEMRAHHGDLVAHSKTETHRKNATPFSNTRTLRCWCIIGEGGHISESGRVEVGCPHCLPLQRSHRRPPWRNRPRRNWQKHPTASHEMRRVDPPCPRACHAARKSF